MEHYPNQGKNHEVKPGGFESAGAPGDKEPEPADYGSMKSEEGYHDTAAISALARKHGLPTSGPKPDNFAGGEIEMDDPTRGNQHNF